MGAIVAVCAAHSFLVGNIVFSFAEDAVPFEQTLEALIHAMRQCNHLYNLHFARSGPLLGGDNGLNITSNHNVKRIPHVDIGFHSLNVFSLKLERVHCRAISTKCFLVGVYTNPS